VLTEAQRDTEIKRAMAMREAAVAKAQADQDTFPPLAEAV